MRDQYCGLVLDYRPSTSASFGSITLRDTGIALFPVAPGADMREDVASIEASSNRCYATALDSSGDAYITGRVIRAFERAVARFEACGRVTRYEKASTGESGVLAIGTRTWPIERGFTYTGDPAGDRVDHTAVGTNVCAIGELSSTGELIGFITQPFRELSCGRISLYQAATAASPGYISFGAGPYRDYTRATIPAGKDLPASVGDDLCVRVSVAVDGNAVVTARAFPDRNTYLDSAPTRADPSPDVPLADLALAPASSSEPLSPDATHGWIAWIIAAGLTLALALTTWLAGGSSVRGIRGRR
jgi:hypothetical protein